MNKHMSKREETNVLCTTTGHFCRNPPEELGQTPPQCGPDTRTPSKEDGMQGGEAELCARKADRGASAR